MQTFPWIKFSFAATGLMGIGYLLMKATVPTEQQLYSEMSPDLRKKVDAARAARLAREGEAQHQLKAQAQLAPDATKPIWADKPEAK
ncbi:hypothetical protein BDN72DRAFT_846930 [Pluteus cervinus]|uniref:Uncharacterized protein n=1 Tax=Pluteus cervinus TaxID=181527 RepID=A0ACD3AFJ5_9AGAR|nr:hypothetical protein BDN72DRAFT_846930 [Pluteus cervinus]